MRRLHILAPPKVHVLQKAHKYCNVQVPVPKAVAIHIIAWGQAHIPAKNLFTKDIGYSTGRTLDSHITLKWGLAKNTDVKHAKRIIGAQVPFHVRLGTVKKFENPAEGFDAIYVEVKSPVLGALHKQLSKIPGSVETRAGGYKPHITVAYVEPGKADHLLGSANFGKKSFKATVASFKSKEGGEAKIPMLGKTAKHVLNTTEAYKYYG